MSDTFDPIAFLSVVSGDGDWSDEFLAWYEPGKWLSEERACAAFIADKFVRLQASNDGYLAFLAEKFVRLQAERDAGGPAATGRALAAQAPQAAEPENPHERDDFRQLCRELDVRGTAMEAVCGAFWIRGAAAQPLTMNGEPTPQAPAAQPLTQLELDGLVAKVRGYKPAPPPYIGHLIARAVEAHHGIGIAPSAHGKTE